MVIRELLHEIIQDFKKNNIENSVFEANLIVRTVLKLSPIDMVLSHEKEVEEKQEKAIREYEKRRILGEPMQYILGTQEFMGLEFIVDKNVLVPRADTETLVEEVLKENKGMSVLDICTGSGCIGLSIAHYNKKAFVLGLDISEAALQVAEKNAEKLKLSDRVRFEKTDILSQTPSGVFDVIVSNPPYIESAEIEKLQVEVKGHEPHIALDGGADGLDFYRRIINIAPKLLQEKGKLYFEVGFNQAEEVKKLMEKHFDNVEAVKDLCGVLRVVKGEVKCLKQGKF